MNKETELKLLASANASSEICETLHNSPCIEKQQQTLLSVYFDTPNHIFYQHDIGLRIRHHKAKRVQTLKTAGLCLGGLHQRPEYNVAIEHARPNLHLFKDVHWPSSMPVDDIQAQLAPLFSTDFERQTWLVKTPDDALIEIAFDKGELKANTQREAICEFELELIRGNENALFALAAQIIQCDGLRLANISKAQRGYQLAQAQHLQTKALTIVPLEQDCQSVQAIGQIFTHALNHWQHHEQCYFEQPKLKTLEQLYSALQMFYQVARNFDRLDLLSCPYLRELRWLRKQLHWLRQAQSLKTLLNKRGDKLKKMRQSRLIIAQLEEQWRALPQIDTMRAFFQSQRYCQLMLGLTQWVYQAPWQHAALPPLNNMAKQVLQHTWERITSSSLNAPALSANDYRKQSEKLQRNLHVGHSFAALFDETQRQVFRLPWLDVLNGMEELSLYSPLHQINTERFNDEDRKQLQRWLARKEESLLEAMGYSLKQAWQQTPYW